MLFDYGSEIVSALEIAPRLKYMRLPYGEQDAGPAPQTEFGQMLDAARTRSPPTAQPTI
jgi:hypothetical protein